jgi:hypothetical protein
MYDIGNVRLRLAHYERLQHLDGRRTSRLRGLLEAVAVKVKSRGRLKVSGHEEDNRIYECAVAANARSRQKPSTS